jgi:hypothetical protein
MTPRELAIAKAILDFLHAEDRHSRSEVLIHAAVDLALEAHVPLSEFKAVFNQCDARGFLIGIESRFKGKRWAISDEGEAARLEM